MCLLRVRRLLVDVVLPVAAEADDERTVEIVVGDDSARLVVDTGVEVGGCELVIGVVDTVVLPVAAEADDERTVEVDVGDDSARLVVDTVVIWVVDNFGLPAAEADDERTVEVVVGDDSARLVVDTGVKGSSPPVLKIGPGTEEGGRSTIIVAVIGSIRGLVVLRLVSVSCRSVDSGTGVRTPPGTV